MWCDRRQRDNVADLNQEDGLLTMTTTAELHGTPPAADDRSQHSLGSRKSVDRKSAAAAAGSVDIDESI